MRKAIPLIAILLAATIYVYFAHIRPSREVDPTVRATGSIEADEVTVSPKLPGRIVAIAAAEGDAVRAGTALVTFDCAELEARVAQGRAQVEQARSLLAQAEAASRQARVQLKPLEVQKKSAEREQARTASLKAVDGVPAFAVDQAETAVETVAEQMGVAKSGAAVAQRAIAVAAAQVALAESGVAAIEVQRAECSLLAPADGVVLARNYEPGEIALPGAAILELGRLDRVHTWIYVANAEVGRVRLGLKVKLAADTYPGRTFVGTVVRVNERAEFTPKSIQTKDDRTRLVFGVKVAIDNPDRALLPGMPVEAALVESAKPGVR
jgi:HlyD family secretion protein